MKHFIFSIYDAKADAYLPPFYLHQKAMAIRAFTDSVNSTESQIHLHPADYTLFHLGEFDDNTGKIETGTSISLGNGIEFVKTEPDETQLSLIEETA